MIYNLSRNIGSKENGLTALVIQSFEQRDTAVLEKLGLIEANKKSNIEVDYFITEAETPKRVLNTEVCYCETVNGNTISVKNEDGIEVTTFEIQVVDSTVMQEAGIYGDKSVAFEASSENKFLAIAADGRDYREFNFDDFAQEIEFELERYQNNY